MTKIEKKLRDSIGQYVVLRYILPDGNPESVSGILEEVSEECIKITGIATHIMNRRTVQLLEVMTRAVDDDKKET